MVRITVNLDQIPDVVTLPPGKYQAKVAQISEEESKRGNDQYIWTWQVIKGEYAGQKIKSFTLLEEYQQSLKEHLVAFGLSGKVDIDTSKLIGRRAVIVVEQRKVSNRSGNSEFMAPYVAKVLPASESQGLILEDE